MVELSLKEQIVLSRVVESINEKNDKLTEAYFYGLISQGMDDKEHPSHDEACDSLIWQIKSLLATKWYIKDKQTISPIISYIDAIMNEKCQMQNDFIKLLLVIFKIGREMKLLDRLETNDSFTKYIYNHYIMKEFNISEKDLLSQDKSCYKLEDSEHLTSNSLGQVQSAAFQITSALGTVDKEEVFKVIKDVFNKLVAYVYR